MAIFGVITGVFLFSWNGIVSNQADSTSNDMRTEARYTTTFLVSTSGYPEDWNRSNVEIPGFASDDNFLEEEKIQEFSRLNYQQQKRLFKTENFYLEFSQNETPLSGESGTLGSEPVAYMVESSSNLVDVKLISAFNNSEVTWDLYWPSGSDEEEIEKLDYRNLYNYTTDGEVMMNDLVANASGNEYSTVIAEDVNVDGSELSNPGQLNDFVENGGSFLHTESDPHMITNTFDLNESDDDSENAEVLKVSPLLNSSLNEGDNIEFDDSNAAYEDPDVIYADGLDSDAGCVACKWEIGAGKLFYLSDTFSDNNDLSLAFEDAKEAIGTDYQFGIEPVDASTVTPVTRDILVNTSGGVKDAEMQYIVWR